MAGAQWSALHLNLTNLSVAIVLLMVFAVGPNIVEGKQRSKEG